MNLLQLPNNPLKIQIKNSNSVGSGLRGNNQIFPSKLAENESILPENFVKFKPSFNLRGNQIHISHRLEKLIEKSRTHRRERKLTDDPS